MPTVFSRSLIEKPFDAQHCIGAHAHIKTFPSVLNKTALKNWGPFEAVASAHNQNCTSVINIVLVPNAKRNELRSAQPRG